MADLLRESLDLRAYLDGLLAWTREPSAAATRPRPTPSVSASFFMAAMLTVSLWGDEIADQRHRAADIILCDMLLWIGGNDENSAAGQVVARYAAMAEWLHS